MHFILKKVSDSSCQVIFEFNQKKFALTRDCSEDIEKLLNRLQLNCERTFPCSVPLKKKQKGVVEREVHVPSITLQIMLRSEEGLIIPLGTAWDVLSQVKYVDFVRSDESTPHTLSVLINPPAIIDCSVQSQIIADHPICVLVDLENATLDDVTIKWFSKKDISKCLHEGQVFTPTKDLVGQRLQVEIAAKKIHGDAGERSCETAAVQEWTLNNTWREKRIATMASKIDSANGFRVVSFNLLAPVFARTSFACRVMYPNCVGTDNLNAFRRIVMIGRELLDLQGDILGLQEVSDQWWRTYLSPLLSHDGFECAFDMKSSNALEGVVLALRKSVFSDIHFEVMDFRRELLANPKASFIRQSLAKKWNVFFEEILPHLTTIMQFAVCRHIATDKWIVVANTHLYFHPDAGAFRALQIWLMLEKIQELRILVAERFEGDGNVDAVEVVLVGDLNSSAVATSSLLLRGETIHPHELIWTKGKEFKWGKKNGAEQDAEEEVEVEMQEEVEIEIAEGLNLQTLHLEDQWHTHKARIQFGKKLSKYLTKSLILKHEENSPSENVEVDMSVDGVTLAPPIALEDAYEILGEPLPWSTKVAVFEGRLDWILSLRNGGLQPVRVLGGMTQEDFESIEGLPSANFPSDHLSIAADYQFVVDI
eukprot:GDKJ01015965.1.p1 GENE.GDKJ01015965.1~~GDKJ01015965.1.p1  ORF type:complete len:651 (-),score=113.22 GDKJ01015965.1:63-2015(-)